MGEVKLPRTLFGTDYVAYMLQTAIRKYCSDDIDEAVQKIGVDRSHIENVLNLTEHPNQKVLDFLNIREIKIYKSNND